MKMNKHTISYKTSKSIYSVALVMIATVWCASCAVNPVTGKRELFLVSEEKEIQLGAENYVPAQQSQGGKFIVEPSVSRYVASVGNKLAVVSDRPSLPYEFVVLNNSVPNAWAPFWTTRTAWTP